MVLFLFNSLLTKVSDLTRYTRNRNLWKKVSGQHLRQKPRVEFLVDQITELSYSLDLTKVTRFRSPYLIPKGYHYIQPLSFVTGEYQEGIIAVNGSDYEYFEFSSSFTGTPSVVLTLENISTSGSSNVFAIGVNSSSFSYALSAEFYGQIRYRAIYSPSYPALVSSSYSSSFVACGGMISTDDSNPSVFGASFNTGFEAPIKETRTTPNFIGNPFSDPIDANVATTSLHVENLYDYGIITGSVSAPLSNLSEIHYLTVLDYEP